MAIATATSIPTAPVEPAIRQSFFVSGSIVGRSAITPAPANQGPIAPRFGGGGGDAGSHLDAIVSCEPERFPSDWPLAIPTPREERSCPPQCDPFPMATTPT